MNGVKHNCLQFSVRTAADGTLTLVSQSEAFDGNLMLNLRAQCDQGGIPMAWTALKFFLLDLMETLLMWNDVNVNGVKIG